MVTKERIEEAYRYIDNAKGFLSEKAKKKEGLYHDSKYVKIAGDTAYKAVLLALDGLFSYSGKTRPDVHFYRKNLSKIDKKMLAYFNSAYSVLHLSMGYDGNQVAGVAQEGLNIANKIVGWVEKRLK